MALTHVIFTRVDADTKRAIERETRARIAEAKANGAPVPAMADVQRALLQEALAASEKRREAKAKRANGARKAARR